MKAFFFLIFLSIFSCPVAAQSQSADSGSISAIISEKGLNFVKDLLIEQELRALVPLKLKDVEKSIRIPLIGSVYVSLANITVLEVSVSSSTVHPGDTGVVIVASGATANLSMDWRYSYRTWLTPVEISDKGSALVQVEGMQVGLTISMKTRNGTLQLTVLECGCSMKDLSITLEGGASWFYQGFVIAFEDQIRSAMESAITKKITEGTSKLDLFLRSLPKEINVDNNVALNVTFMNDPILGDSSVEFDINGLFIPSDKVALPRNSYESSQTSISCLGAPRMLGISLDETVFTSAAAVYFQAGSMHWLVDKVPDQSLLNTASWKFIIPQLYWKYPNDDMELNITLISPPVMRIKPEGIGATITAEMTANVLHKSESIPVACIMVVVSVSGVVEISGNNLAGKAELNDFTLSLKWSKVGNFHMYLIQGVMKVFLNTVFIPLVNSHLKQGFPLPIIHGFTLQDAEILTSSSKIVVCSDVVFTNSNSLMRFLLQNYSSMLRLRNQWK
ncbi:uncharacterized protein A4U43_C05F21040 [Asparagus officinalis]|uniref:Lipid-binding serum glycoprotein C-terminal domain-containing protein n=1 Tax=Asparagus officinalis TaxID=4686 RepID=A0A5P1ETY0_ASPOF|nr:putative BPI/LBP family protein At1g04970 [Asparagus officinalis]ONK69264.1 uncharacterized protein A4U43_C05F21040 [Asparagus officinalis]